MTTFEFAQQQVAQAEINLGRTRVRSPVDGYVTNLQMRVGDYAHASSANILDHRQRQLLDSRMS
jgi:multidrug resistance efflux pump